MDSEEEAAPFGSGGEFIFEGGSLSFAQSLQKHASRE